MVTIRYRLTPNDLAEIEAERRGGFLQQVFRIIAAAFLGLVGLIFLWQALIVFPWSRPPVNFGLVGLGVSFLWMGFEMPGMNWLFKRLCDPFAECEVHVYEGKVATLCKGTSRQFRWLPQRGLKETGKFFVLSAFKSGQTLVIPKHAVTREQEESLRDLAQNDPVAGSAVEFSFYLTQEDLIGAGAAAHPWLGSTYGRTLSRVVFGLCSAVLPATLWTLRKVGNPFFRELTTEPLIVACLVAYELLCLWGASGYIGLKAFNRLNQERRIRMDNREVVVTRGARTKTHGWKSFLCYQETATLFVLRTLIRVEFVTIPKRVLHPGDEEKIRTLLTNHLPDRLAAF